MLLANPWGGVEDIAVFVYLEIEFRFIVLLGVGIDGAERLLGLYLVALLRLFLDIPVPIISSSLMIRIDKLVKEAHAKRYEANETERKAIRIVEQEIEKWSK